MGRVFGSTSNANYFVACVGPVCVCEEGKNGEGTEVPRRGCGPL